MDGVDEVFGKFAAVDDIDILRAEVEEERLCILPKVDAFLA